jgi:hypothetical protein
MTNTGKILLIVGGSVAVVGTVGIIGYKKGWFGSSKKDERLINLIQGWLDYQKANNWSVVNKGEDARIKSAVYESFKNKLNDEELHSKYDMPFGGNNWEAKYSRGLEVKNSLNF